MLYRLVYNRKYVYIFYSITILFSTVPFQATFVINQNGVIILSHFDSDYKERSSVGAILKSLNN
jgi:peroxiredoxin